MAVELHCKCVELLHDMLPTVQRIAGLFNAEDPSWKAIQEQVDHPCAPRGSCLGACNVQDTQRGQRTTSNSGARSRPPFPFLVSSGGSASPSAPTPPTSVSITAVLAGDGKHGSREFSRGAMFSAGSPVMQHVCAIAR